MTSSQQIDNLSSQVNMLSGQVNVLTARLNAAEQYFIQKPGWIIAGITLTIAALIGLFSLIQFIYARKIEEKRLAKIKEDIIEETSKKLGAILAENISELRKDINKIELDHNAEIARLLGITASDSELNERAFYWWLRCAYYNNQLKSSDMVDVAFKSAEKALTKISSNEISGLKKNLDQTQKFLKGLSESHPARSDMLLKKLLEVIENYTFPVATSPAPASMLPPKVWAQFAFLR